MNEQEQKIIDAAISVSLFSRTHDWPREFSPEWFEYAHKLDLLATELAKLYPSLNRIHESKP